MMQLIPNWLFVHILLPAIWWGPVCKVVCLITIPLRFCMQWLMLLRKDHSAVLLTWQTLVQILDKQEQCQYLLCGSDSQLLYSWSTAKGSGSSADCTQHVVYPPDLLQQEVICLLPRTTALSSLFLHESPLGIVVCPPLLP